MRETAFESRQGRLKRRLRLGGAVLVAAAALDLASVTQSAANVAAPIRDPARIGPALAAKTPLVVTEEQLAFQCDELDDQPVCTFEARYRISNPTSQPAGGRAAFYGLHSDSVSVTVDGRSADLSLSPEDTRLLDEEVDASAAWSPSEESAVGERDAVSRHGFALLVPPAGQAEIVVRGRTKPGRTSSSHGYVYTPAVGRHLLLHGGEPEPRVFELEYLVSPIRSWASVGRMRVSIRYPKSWSVNPSLWSSVERAQSPWETRIEGGWVTASVVTGGKLDEEPVGNTLTFYISLPGSAAEHGGPYVGVGSVLGSSDANGFRMRFGYEIASPTWLVESLSVDTNFDGRAAVALNLEAALPHLAIIPVLPSLAVGVGAPVQIVPKAAPGVRLMGGVQFWAIGFVTSVDMYPGLSRDEGSLQLTMLGRLSL